MFYPQLVAGPIERPQNLLPQFYEKHKFVYQRVTDGLKLMAWGMYKKVVIADRLAVLVNYVYKDVHAQSSFSLFVATIFFSIQIYCDFSGYTDIARGAAKVMGFRLMKNFNYPYLSKSIKEFWRRWHISLSTWFTDYLYRPLGGNRVSKIKWCFVILIVFIVSGLWHGANWTFIIWGGLHGLYMIFGNFSKGWRDQVSKFAGFDNYPTLVKVFKISSTFSLVSFSWIFFRANNLNDAIYVAKSFLLWVPEVTRAFLRLDFKYIVDLVSSIFNLGLIWYEMIIAIIAILSLGVCGVLQRNGSLYKILYIKSMWLRWSLYYGIIMGIIIFGYYNLKPSSFIYFQF